MNRIILTTLLLLFPLTILAEETTSNECHPVVEKELQWQTLRIRPHENELITCTLAQEQFNKLIRESLENSGNEQSDYHSLFMGRLVDHPWISKYLAVQALGTKDWDAEKGRPKEGEINSFVRKLLTSPELLGQIQIPFTETGYTVIGASVEKVLVVKANEIKWLDINEPVLVPYDAMVHFILEKSEKD